MSPFWHPMGETLTITLDSGEDFLLRSLEAEVMILAQRFRWPASDVYALPVSERKRYVEAVTKVQQEEKRKIEEAAAKSRKKG